MQVLILTQKEIENGLMNNGGSSCFNQCTRNEIDKSDIRFIIHTQIQLHQYTIIKKSGEQEDGKPTKLILFYNSTKDKNGIEEDFKLQKLLLTVVTKY